MYVEFVGVPGAGKTTLTEQVISLLEKKGLRCATRASFFGPNKKWLHKSLWSLLHPQYLDLYGLKLWLQLSLRKHLGVGKTLTRIHEYQKLLYQLAETEEEVVSVWDNGFVQWFSNYVLAGVLSERAVVDFIKRRLPKDTLLVFADTPVTVSFERMQEREARLRTTKGTLAWTPSTAEIQEKQESFMQSEHTQKSILNALAERRVSVFLLDGMKSPGENATLIGAKIEAHLSI